MFKELLLKNFKGWEATGNIKLAPITLFFGSNSSGKTSLLQSLLLLKQSAESADRKRPLYPGDKNTLVDLGTTADLVFGHDLKRDLEFLFRWGLPGLQIQQDYFNEIQFTVRIGFRDGGQPVVKMLRYYLDSAHVTMERKTIDGGYSFAASGFSEAQLLDNDGALLPPPVRYYGFPAEVRNFVKPSEWLSDLSLALEQQMERIHYVGPLREYPERMYLWAGEVPNDVGTRGTYAVHAILAARNEGRRIGRGVAPNRREVAFEEVIGEWLQRFGVIHSFSLRPIAEARREYELRVKRTPDSPEVFITDVGFGVSQVLPVLVQSFYAEENSTIIFEQPEIHLHPRVQADLADVFIDAFRNCGVQFVIESHSEHLLRRLQRRIAEGNDIKSEDVAIYVCDVDGGRSHISRLKIDEFGNISNWPKDFFGDEVGDLIKMAEATMRRQGFDGPPSPPEVEQ